MLIYQLIQITCHNSPTFSVTNNQFHQNSVLHHYRFNILLSSVLV